MDKKLFKELIQPYLTIDVIAMVLLSVFVLMFSVPWGIVSLAITVAVSVYHSFVASNKSAAQLEEIRQGVADENEEITRAFIDSSPVCMSVTDASGKTYWTSQSFRENITNKDSLEGILSKEELEKLFANEKAEVIVPVNERKYSVTPSAEDDYGHSKRMLFWNDVTSNEIVKERFRNDRPCMAVISVDNYDELMASSPTEEQSGIAAEIDKVIRDWAQTMEASIARVKGGNRYVMYFTNVHIAEQQEKKFPVLAAMHDVKNSADFPTTISVGISLGQPRFDLLEEQAIDAHELALGRGGDQVVVKRVGGEIEYYGGATSTVTSRNKGRSRIMGHAIAQLVKSASSVVIVGHVRPDMDCLGAAIGMAELAEKYNKNVSICTTGASESIDLLYEAALETGAYHFISQAEAKARLGENALLIIVDTSAPAIVEAKELLDAPCKRIVVDHHRRGASIVDNLVLNYTEAGASSTSELVAEMLQYQDFEYNRFALEALLAGITVDTKNFTVNTGARTFEAASWLKRNGADGNAVKNFFKMRLDFYQKKVNMIASAELVGKGIAVAYTRESDPSMQVLVAQAADELLQMRDINTAFVAGRGEGKTMVSARSNGTMNVQSFLEKLGGGGHLNVAAAQMDEAPEEAIAKIVNLLREEEII